MKTKATHTPGPWSDGTGWIFSKKDNSMICGNFPRIYLDDGQAEANACLIAAAPDLLAALKDALSGFMNESHPCDIGAIREAINKAEGR